MFLFFVFRYLFLLNLNPVNKSLFIFLISLVKKNFRVNKVIIKKSFKDFPYNKFKILKIFFYLCDLVKKNKKFRERISEILLIRYFGCNSHHCDIFFQVFTTKLRCRVADSTLDRISGLFPRFEYYASADISSKCIGNEL